MRAMVCDCCGKTVLIADEPYMYAPQGIHTLRGDSLPRKELDLCEECVGRLMAAVKESAGGGEDG